MKKTLLLIALTMNIANAKVCDEKFGKYGNDIQYQNAYCTFFISANKIDNDTYRNVTFGDSGIVQFFSNFPGTTNSNSTGARVYYFFPTRDNKSITNASTNGLNVKHGSGVNFSFDKDGNFTSPDLKIKVDPNINSKNKGGVEIESYSKGLVIDIGYRMGNSPTLNKNATVTITDKNTKKCTMPNIEFHTIDKFNVNLTYPTNESLYHFLKVKCPELDLTDLMAPLADEVLAVGKKVNATIAPPPADNKLEENNLKRDAKKQDANEEVKKLPNLPANSKDK